MPFKRIRTDRVYQQVLDQIAEEIQSGELSLGDKLPSERDMSRMMSVSRGSVREALTVLEALGVIEVRHGEGLFVAKDSKNLSLINPFGALFVNDEQHIREIYEVRFSLELSAARVAAERATEEDVRALEKEVEAISQAHIEAMSTGQSRLQHEFGDLQFHTAVAQAAKNRFLVAIIDGLLRHLLTYTHRLFMQHIRHHPSEREVAKDINRGMLRAIANGDPDMAEESMRKHLQQTLEGTLKQMRKEHAEEG